MAAVFDECAPDERSVESRGHKVKCVHSKAKSKLRRQGQQRQQEQSRHGQQTGNIKVALLLAS